MGQIGRELCRNPGVVTVLFNSKAAQHKAVLTPIQGRSYNQVGNQAETNRKDMITT